MFASVGNSLFINVVEKGGVKTISKFVSDSLDPIQCISWCHDNSYIALLRKNRYPEILSTKDPNNIEVVHTINSVSGVTSLNFKRNTKRILALGNSEGEVMLYDTKNRCVTKHLGQLPFEVNCIEFNCNNQLAAIGGNHLVRFNIYDDHQKEVKNPDECTALKCFNKNPNHVVVGCINGMVIIWDVEREIELIRYQSHSSRVSGLALAKNDQEMVSCGEDNKICLMDNFTQEYLFRKHLPHPITSVDISSDDQHMAVGLNEGSVYVYNMKDHLKPLICLKVHKPLVNQVAFLNNPEMEIVESERIPEPSSCAVKNQNENTCMEQEDIVRWQNVKNLAEESSSTTIREDVSDDEDQEICEETVKLELMKLINGYFNRLEESVDNHCQKFQSLISTELNSLYSLAARWECFNTMQMEEIVKYILGIISAYSDSGTLKSEHTFTKEK